MTLFRNKYRIESTRLPGWSYSSPGVYFVTVCSYNRINLFGDVAKNEMHLNEYGCIFADEWIKSFNIREELLSDEFIVMPNHLHAIVHISCSSCQNADVSGHHSKTRNYRDETPSRASLRIGLQPGQDFVGLRSASISSFIAGLKSAVTKRINTMRQTPGTPVFQKRFYDHIVRNEKDLIRIREYIRNNPANWEHDTLNCLNSNSH